MDPKFTVIIPVYNGEKFLAKTVQSVLNQSYPAHKIIAIDDGSTDSAPDILRSFGSRIIVKRVPNGGVSSARNHAMRMATGDWLTFLDSDDLWFKNKLERQAEFIRKSPETGLFYCNFFMRDPSRGMRLVRGYSLMANANELNFDAPFAQDPFRALIQENIISCPSGVALKKTVADQVGFFDVEDPVSQDYDYWLRCAMVTNFWFSSETLYYKRMHGANLSNNRISVYTHHLRILTRLLTRDRQRLADHELRRFCTDNISKTLLELGNSYYETGNRAKAFGIYFKGLVQSRTPVNAARFAGVLARKGSRLITGGLVSRHTLSRLSGRSRGDAASQ